MGTTDTSPATIDAATLEAVRRVRNAASRASLSQRAEDVDALLDASQRLEILFTQANWPHDPDDDASTPRVAPNHRGF